MGKYILLLIIDKKIKFFHGVNKFSPENIII